ncbi:MAG: DUF2189 domain-containing protein [Pseudomonadota bacterium]
MTLTDASDSKPAKPVIREITTEDVRAALSAGFADFRRAPMHGMFFGLIFSLIGIAIAYLFLVLGSSSWILPLAAGFPLIGPFAAIGLYEISRRLEAGEPLDWPGILGAVMRSGRTQLPSYAFVVLFIYMVWVYLAHLIFALSFGISALTNVSSSFEILLTPNGIIMLLIGTVVGGAVAALLFAISVISVPLMLDRDIDIVTAMVTSVQAVSKNLKPMVTWAAILAVASAVAMLPLFLGMVLVFPVLGHTSWHLYRRTIA